MRVALVIEDDSVMRRQIADALLAAGFGVCEAFRADLLPFTPRLDVVVTDVEFGGDVPVVRTVMPFDHRDLLARVTRAIGVTETRAA